MTLARIELACNDGDNGNFIGFVSGVQVGDLELMSNRWWLTSRPGPLLRIEDGRFIMSGKAWPYERYKGYFGNWVWDAFWVEPEVCADFLIWLHKRGCMDVDQAEPRIYNLWKGEAPLDPDRDFLIRYFGKPSTYSHEVMG